MKQRIYYQKEGCEAVEKYYPNEDISKSLPGLDEGTKLWFIEEAEKPSINPDFQRLEKRDNLTDKKHAEYSHFLICERSYDVVDDAKATVIQKLNNSLGEHLDNNYLPQTRQKHSDELNGIYGEITEERRDWLMVLKNWMMNQIALRDNEEVDLVENNIFPVYDWEPMPEK